MWNRFKFLVNRLGERLWVRPLAFCALSITAAFIAKAADGLEFGDALPAIKPESIEALLSVTAASMLVIATLAVASMVSAYASAAGSATPRSFSLLVADDKSQNALSTFMGAFIYAIVALIALKNDYYGQAGHLLLFGITVGVLALVVVTFVRWVDWIARLGRIGTTIDKVEAAAELNLEDMLNDAFRPIARDGASTVEVQIRLQKALASLAALGNQSLKSAAAQQSRRALARAKNALDLPDDFQAVADAASWSA